MLCLGRRRERRRGTERRQILADRLTRTRPRPTDPRSAARSRSWRRPPGRRCRPRRSIRRPRSARRSTAASDPGCRGSARHCSPGHPAGRPAHDSSRLRRSTRARLPRRPPVASSSRSPSRPGRRTRPAWPSEMRALRRVQHAERDPGRSARERRPRSARVPCARRNPTDAVPVCSTTDAASASLLDQRQLARPLLCRPAVHQGVLDDALVDVGRRRRGRLCGGDNRVSRAQRDVSLYGVDVSLRLLDEVHLLAAPQRRGILALLVDEHRLLRMLLHPSTDGRGGAAHDTVDLCSEAIGRRDGPDVELGRRGGCVGSLFAPSRADLRIVHRGLHRPASIACMTTAVTLACASATATLA